MKFISQGILIPELPEGSMIFCVEMVKFWSRKSKNVSDGQIPEDINSSPECASRLSYYSRFPPEPFPGCSNPIVSEYHSFSGTPAHANQNVGPDHNIQSVEHLTSLDPSGHELIPEQKIQQASRGPEMLGSDSIDPNSNPNLELPVKLEDLQDLERYIIELLPE